MWYTCLTQSQSVITKLCAASLLVKLWEHLWASLPLRLYCAGVQSRRLLTLFHCRHQYILHHHHHHHHPPPLCRREERTRRSQWVLLLCCLGLGYMRESVQVDNFRLLPLLTCFPLYRFFTRSRLSCLHEVSLRLAGRCLRFGMSLTGQTDPRGYLFVLQIRSTYVTFLFFAARVLGVSVSLTATGPVQGGRWWRRERGGRVALRADNVAVGWLSLRRVSS